MLADNSTLQLALKAATLYGGDGEKGHHVAVVERGDRYFVYDDLSSHVAVYNNVRQIPDFGSRVALLFYVVVLPTTTPGENRLSYGLRR